MPLFLFILIFYNIHTFIQSQYSHPSPFAEASLHFLIAWKFSGETSLWCRAEIRTWACLTASRRAANWATPHHLFNLRYFGWDLVEWLERLTANGLVATVPGPILRSHKNYLFQLHQKDSCLVNLAATSLFATIGENYVHPDNENKKVTNCATRTPGFSVNQKKRKKATENWEREKESRL
jgi:hypothetical protein